MKTSAPQVSDGVTGWKVEVIKKLAAALRVLMAQSVLCWQKTDTESVCGVCVWFFASQRAKKLLRLLSIQMLLSQLREVDL